MSTHYTHRRKKASELKKRLLTFRLPTSNRLIAWAEFGSPTGRPVIFLHGTPSSRLECQEFHEELYAKNIRLIAPDRPGFGRSEFHRNRTIGGSASDVQALAKHLELPEYVVIGGSGGGPYALACARHINPDDGLRAVAVLAGIAPWECTLKDVNWNTKLCLYMTKWTPGLLRWLSGYSLPVPKKRHTVPLEDIVVDPSVEADVNKKIEALIKQLKPKDQEAMNKPGSREYFATFQVIHTWRKQCGFTFLPISSGVTRAVLRPQWSYPKRFCVMEVQLF
ncbi:hypothetical protein AK830_g2908 [Neonectria ditissima]|uniref:AB hydrolase-1 domain-containing protein n=1 Tax=Neonectria ditissima TaxID=78410 RepID=A0A0P7BQI3_9HYPO|nr:hypothetical protein AK830_g2908 [Neonectria ditissima]